MLNPSDKTITRTQQANPPPSFAHHQPYLLQGVLNFFMEQGKVALVASEDDATQAWFDGPTTSQLLALGLRKRTLHARALSAPQKHHPAVFGPATQTAGLRDL